MFSGKSESVREFYEAYPYPALPVKKKEDLLNKMHANVMKNILGTLGIDGSELKGKDVLDAGCGTGEKALYFALHGAHVTAFDRNEPSLEIGERNAKKFRLKINFRTMDLFNAELKGEMFDYVFCLGVLHHTHDPYVGFLNLLKWVRKNGTVTIGLYNKYGRFLHRVRRKWIQMLGGRGIKEKMKYVSRAIYRREFRSEHEKAYVADKFVNPHESYHSLEEVIRWFKSNDVELIGIWPEVSRGYFLTQIGWFLKRKGFFIVSGRKR